MSLFTNVPVDETIDVCIDLLYYSQAFAQDEMVTCANARGSLIDSHSSKVMF